MIRKYYVASVILLLSSQAHALSDTTLVAGNVMINIENCDDVGPAEHNQTTCSQPTSGGFQNDGYVTIGGGAAVDGDVDPGALLVSSYLEPTSNFTSWVAASKDHEFYYPHKLKVYSIG